MSLSVKEGDSVTLFSQLTEIKKDDVIDWRFGDILIARVRNNKNPSVYEDALDGKFKDRLKLDGQTGDLTITNFRNTDSGEYEVTNSINTFRKKFSVTVYSGLSSGKIAAIVIGVLVLLVAAAVVIGVICYKYSVFSETMSLSVKEGDSVTLFSRLTEIKKDDVIDWRFGDFLIARVRNNKNPSVYEDALDGKFRGRLKLDGQTGDLTITNFRNTDSGEYEVTNSINTFRKKFNVTVHSGLSSGKIAAIVVGVLVLLVAAAVGGGICYKKI